MRTLTPACAITTWAQLLALTVHPARRWEPTRLRLLLFSIAGRPARTGRRVVLHLSGHAPWTGLVLEAIKTLPHWASPAEPKGLVPTIIDARTVEPA